MADDDKRDDKLLVLPLGEESKLITQTIANDTARQILELLADGALSTSAIAKKLDIPLTTAQYNVEKLIEAKLVIVEKTKYSEKGREVKLYAPAKRMIVLVPANTPRQAVMDVLKKYLVLVPVAGFLALLVELAMAFLDGSGTGGSPAAKSAGDGAPFLAAQGSNLTAPAPGVSDAWSNGLPEVTGHVTNAATALNNSSGPGLYAATPNGTLPLDSAGGYGVYAPELNRSLESAPAASTALPQPAGASHGLVSADLFNHYGLWFFIGCLLIIGVMVAYELYRGRKKR
ncbi:MAG TPA: winged helix-turn-helix domain-containing protein [Methanocella sp.]|nr:winged helix-turn-helix domain-containing protein [Methanocella sp.]